MWRCVGCELVYILFLILLFLITYILYVYQFIYYIHTYLGVLLVGLKVFLQNWWSAQLKRLGTAELKDLICILCI